MSSNGKPRSDSRLSTPASWQILRDHLRGARRRILARLQNIGGLTREIDARNEKFGGFREKRGYLLDAIKTALIPVQLLGDLTAGTASVSFLPASLAFGALTYLINAVNGVSASYYVIQDLMGTLKVRSTASRSGPTRCSLRASAASNALCNTTGRPTAISLSLIYLCNWPTSLSKVEIFLCRQQP
ncbi:hypothetical protein BDV09DRAFT_173056 [Aspergillus tetrazonus]